MSLIQQKNNAVRDLFYGFTLLEVMVALAIAAIGLVAVSKAMTQSVDLAGQLQTRTIASWVASNRMAMLRMERQFTQVGSKTSEQIMAGQHWEVIEEYFSTSDPNISRVSVKVFHESDRDRVLATSVGFLARYKPAKQGF